MDSELGLDLGYSAVDAHANFAFLVTTMDATSRWAATTALRAWERDHLALELGQRLIDVGCGLGDAAIALAADLGSNGELLAVDASRAMLDVARTRAAGASCSIQFAVRDALSLEEPDGSFDAARSERTLQWVSDPAQAVSELYRVLRPGGRLALIDTDWSTLILEVGDDEVAAVVRAEMRQERERPSDVGSRLCNLCRDASFVDIAATAATHVWTSWDPDRFRAPDGFYSLRSLADDLLESGQLDASGADRFLRSIKDAARRDHFFMSLTMFAVAGRRP